MFESRTETLERFYEVLVNEIRERRPAYLSGPFTVAEIYQHLVPYASHRDRLGVEMNGDYEDVLLRLLAGEGGYLELESQHARERLSNELRSPNPDTSLFREFAAVDVRLNRERLAAGGEPARSEGDAEEDGDSEVPVESLAPLAGGSGLDVESPVEGRPEPSPEGGPPAPERVQDGDPGTCQWCRAELPKRENLHYCPFCGTDVEVVPCPSCGEALESGWRFCIACGAGVADE